MTQAEQKPKKCAHAICSCLAAPGSDYCSEYCQKAIETEIRCGCRHPGCA